MIAPEPTGDKRKTGPRRSIRRRKSAPAAILARRMAADDRQPRSVAETIIDKGVSPLRSKPGDILVLVRKRDSFVNALTRALKRRNNIPVAGADRLVLTSHIAIQDLLALGRFLLAAGGRSVARRLLKSPLFDLGEDDVFAVAAYAGDNRKRLEPSADIRR